MNLSYPWPEAFENYDIPLDLTQEQWETVDEMMDAAMREIQEIHSYGVPSQSDRIGAEIDRVKETMSRSHKYETDWRDERIKELENTVDRLWARVERAEREE